MGRPAPSTLIATVLSRGAPSGSRRCSAWVAVADTAVSRVSSAGVILDPVAGQRGGDGCGLGQVAQQAREPGGRKDASEDRDGRAIGQRQTLVGQDLRALRQVERPAFRRVAAARLKRQDLLAGHLSCSPQVLVEPHALADGIVGGRLRHEDARPATGQHQPLLRHRRQRVADRMAVDAEPRRQPRLGRQLVAGSVMARRDLGAQVGGDGPPDRGAGHVSPKIHIRGD